MMRVCSWTRRRRITTHAKAAQDDDPQKTQGPQQFLQVPPRRPLKYKHVPCRPHQDAKRFCAPGLARLPRIARFDEANAGDGHFGAVFKIGEVCADAFPFEIGVKYKATR